MKDLLKTIATMGMVIFLVKEINLAKRPKEGFVCLFSFTWLCSRKGRQKRRQKNWQRELAFTFSLSFPAPGLLLLLAVSRVLAEGSCWTQLLLFIPSPCHLTLLCIAWDVSIPFPSLTGRFEVSPAFRRTLNLLLNLGGKTSGCAERSRCPEEKHFLLSGALTHPTLHFKPVTERSPS